MKVKQKRTDREDYVHIGRWVNPVLILALWLKGKPNRVFKKLGIALSQNKVYLDGNNFSFKQDIKAVKRAAKNKTFVRDFIEHTAQEVDGLNNLIPKLNDFRKYNCLKLFKEFSSQYNQVTGPWNFINPISDEVELEVKKLKSYHQISQSITPSKSTPLSGFKQEIVKLRREIKKKKLPADLRVIEKRDPKLYSRIQGHIKKYEWYGTFHLLGKPYNEKEFIKNITRKKTALKGTLNRSKQVQLLRGLVWLRQYTAENEAKVCYAARGLITELARKLGIGYGDVIYMTPNEIVRHIQAEKRIDTVMLKRRKESFGIYKTKGSEVIIVGKRLEEMLNKWLPQASKRGEIKGVVANKGRVKGRVQILARPQDIKNFQKGRILVAPETTPIYFPAMAEAAAIITDMGGITCHAAIVSRELGIPCIIGTKVATKVLKDGDRVEVDANKGVVRILK